MFSSRGSGRPASPRPPQSPRLSALTFGVLALATLLPPGAAADEEPALPSPLPLPDLLAAVRRRNPMLAERRRLARAAAARPAAEGLVDDPMAMLEWWQQPFDGSSVPWMLTVKQPIPWPSRLRLRREVARREAAPVADEVVAAERQVLAEARRSYFDLLLAEQQLELNQRIRGLLEHLVRLVEIQYRVGKATQAELLRAQEEVLMLDTERLDLLLLKETASIRLNTLADRHAALPIGPTASSPSPAALPSERELFARAQRERPELRRAEHYLAAARARRAETATTALPELAAWGSLMADLRHGHGAFTLGFSSTLPIAARRRERILGEAAAEEIAAAASAIAGLRRETEAQIHTNLAQLDTAKRHVRLHAEKLVPLAEVQLKSAEASYQAGRLPFASLLEAAIAVRRHHLEHVQFLVEYQRRLAELEQVVGGPLDDLGGEK